MPKVEIQDNTAFETDPGQITGTLSDLLTTLNTSSADNSQQKKRKTVTRKQQAENDIWRRKYRRQFLIQQLDSLARLAREEGFSVSSILLNDTANKLRITVFHDE